MGHACCKASDAASETLDHEVAILHSNTFERGETPADPTVQENSVKDLAWVNHALAHLWPEMDQVANHIVETQVLPKIREKLPDSIIEMKFSHFTLGKTAPILGPIHVTNLPDGISRVRVFVEYSSDMYMEVSVVTKLGTVTCGIKELKVSGDIVFRLDPYIPNSPGTSGPTGGVSVYFLDEPEIDFVFSGHAHVIDTIGIKSMVLNAIDGMVCSKVVTPNIVTQLVGLTDFKVYPLVFQSPTPLGVLRVTLQKAAITQHPKEEDEEKGTKSKPVFSIARMKGAASRIGEWVDDRIGDMTGVNTDPYLKLAIGDQIWKPELKKLGATHDFTLFDPEQRFHVSAWDRDTVSEDDMLGRAGPFSMAEAMAASEKAIEILGPEDELYGHVQLKLEWMLATPGVISPGGCIALLTIGELRQEGAGIRDKKLAIRAKIKEVEITTLSGKQIKGAHELPSVIKALEEVRENLVKKKVPEATIKDALALKVENTRLAINSSMHFELHTADLDSAVLELSLVEVVQGKGKDKETKKEIVVGEHKVTLSALKEAEKLTFPGPVVFETSFGFVHAAIHITLSGLTVPGESAVPVLKAAPKFNPVG
mmetsp:Transcript_31010/g.67765  ORF Transcript_31010/g.67765 Transcript_31010/m.67765 type:complete len:595 (-) Transcript_31010:45-1829(-)